MTDKELKQERTVTMTLQEWFDLLDFYFPRSNHKEEPGRVWHKISNQLPPWVE